MILWYNDIHAKIRTYFYYLSPLNAISFVELRLKYKLRKKGCVRKHIEFQ